MPYVGEEGNKGLPIWIIIFFICLVIFGATTLV
jgi:Sec-independent protein translocase protein TatA